MMPRPGMPLLVVGVSLVAAGFAPLPVHGQEATPAACPVTTPEENIALITELYDVLEAGTDPVPLLAPDYTAHLSDGVTRSNFQGWSAETREDFAGLSITPERMIAQDDLVAAYVTWSGTHQDANENLGFPATGQKAEWVVSTFFRIECGKIAEAWPVADALDQLEELGVITDDELQSVEDAATPTP